MWKGLRGVETEDAGTGICIVSFTSSTWHQTQNIQVSSLVQDRQLLRTARQSREKNQSGSIIVTTFSLACGSGINPISFTAFSGS